MRTDSTPRQEPRFLALQYISDGSLEALLYKHRHPALCSDGGWLPLQTQVVVHVGVFCALAYLASLRVIHRDVKPANILVVVNAQQARLEKALLADFGEAKSIRRTITARGTQAGTPVYVTAAKNLHKYSAAATSATCRGAGCRCALL